MTVNRHYQPDQTLSLTLRLPNHVIFKTFIEALRLDPLLYPSDPYRLRARFIRMTSQNREVLIRHILIIQGDRLSKHYSS